MNQRNDPFARLTLVGTLMLALYATFGGQHAAPAPAQAQEIIYLPTPTLGAPPETQPTPPAIEAQTTNSAPAPIAEAPPVVEVPAAAVTNEGSRPAEHALEPARTITIDPQPAEPQAGDVLIQANDGPSFASATNGEGTKPSRGWKP